MYRSALAGLAAAVSLASPNHAAAQQFQATFSGFEEVGALNNESGAIFSAGGADIHLILEGASLTYTLVIHGGLSAPITQAHIHFGKHHVPGGVIVFLCANPPIVPPAGTPACPQAGTVTRTITSADIVGPAAQNIPAGDFAGLVAALENDTAYGNIHSTKFPAGEIRGQIKPAQNNDGLFNLPAQGSQGNQNQP
jgi:hypothetical protein